MSIILDPSKQFIKLKTYYIEEIKPPHGHSVFSFIESRDDLEEWKDKGYILVSEKNDLPPKNPTQLATQQQTGQSQTQPKPQPNPAASQNGKYISEVNTKWTRLTWKEQNAIYSQCMKESIGTDGKLKYSFDNIKYRDLKLKKCLKEWDVKDDNGQYVPVDANVIDNLVPEVAQQLLDDFEKVTEPGADDLKK
jgi:hypothetical protein